MFKSEIGNCNYCESVSKKYNDHVVKFKFYLVYDNTFILES